MVPFFVPSRGATAPNQPKKEHPMKINKIISVQMTTLPPPHGGAGTLACHAEAIFGGPSGPRHHRRLRP